MDEYLKQKAKLFDNMSKKDYAILNADDNKVKELSDSINAKTLFFSIKTPVKEGVFVENNKIVLTLHNKKQVFCKLSDISYLGEHNLSNILCAILVASLMKLKKETIISAINRFKLSPHRLQFVANKQGVDFYDDSKATNVDACLKAVGSFQKNIVLMLGGSDKCENFDELFQKMPKNVVHIVVSGENAQNIIKSANQFGFKQLTEAKNFKDSFEKATQRAKKHEIVLLAPASASFDEFKNYAERGEVFQKLVQAL
jgi:UDP-N-acetylmuramoylalanine--D-glutamate ligase